MNSTEDTYAVVVNGEEQYSIWPTFKKTPPGWKEVGVQGSKEHCLDHIGKIWKDMRPLSLRKKMAEREQTWQEKKATALASPPEPYLSPTVRFLSKGIHPVSLIKVHKTPENVKEALIRNHIHITFTDTQGETTLSLPLDPQSTHFDLTKFDQPQKKLILAGNLILDFVKVRCTAEIDPVSLEGTGSLEIIENLASSYFQKN